MRSDQRESRESRDTCSPEAVGVIYGTGTLDGDTVPFAGYIYHGAHSLAAGGAFDPIKRLGYLCTYQIIRLFIPFRYFSTYVSTSKVAAAAAAAIGLTQCRARRKA